MYTVSNYVIVPYKIKISSVADGHFPIQKVNPHSAQVQEGIKSSLNPLRSASCHFVLIVRTLSL